MLPRLLVFSKERMAEHVASLQQMGLNSEQLQAMLLKEPSLLERAPTKLAANLEVCWQILFSVLV